MNCLYILEINPLSVSSFAIISCHSEGCFFVLLMFSFSVQIFLFNYVLLVYFVFISITLGDGSKRILLQLMAKIGLAMFSSKGFIVSGITFRSLIYFEFNFVYGVRKCSNFIFFTHSWPVFPAPLLEETVFSPLYNLVSFVKD